MMTTLLAHISDFHIAPLPRVGPGSLCNKRLVGYLSWQCKRKKRHRREILERACSDIVAQGPDYCLVNGDITNLGLRAEFEASHDWLIALHDDPERVMLVPGNHDAYVRESERLIHHYWTRWFAGAQQFPWAVEIEDTDAVIIGVSSAVATPPFMATGRIGAAQVGRLAALLDQYGRAGRMRLIMIHHPPVPGIVPARKGLVDWRHLRAVIAGNGAEAILHGHAHFPVRTYMAAGIYNVPVIGAGAASLAHPTHGAHAHYHLLELANRQLTLRHRCYDARQQKFIAGNVEEIDL